METTMENYGMKNVKDGIGHDLSGFQGSLYFNKKKICVVSDDGWGGNYEFHWVSKEAEGEFDSFIAKEKKIREKSWQPGNNLEKEVGFIFDGETFVSDLVDLFFKIKDYKKQCKNNILFQVGKDIGTDKFYIIKGIKYFPENESKLNKFLSEKYKGHKFIILNKELKGEK